MRKPQISGYSIGKKLGEGTFGRVYQALQIESGNACVVKVLKSPMDGDRRRFAYEANALHCQLDNPHVVDLYEYDLDHEPPYLVMEFCEHGTLSDWGEVEHPWNEVAVALLHAVDGLAAIHSADGFHRDIKPQNLLLANSEDGLVVKLADFGLARIPSDSASSMTYSPCGSPAYMAPEVHESFLTTRDHVYSAAADIYSLGITGIELLTGRRDPLALHQAAVPDGFKNMLFEMTLEEADARPSADAVGAGLMALLEEPVQETKRRPRRRNDDGLFSLLVGGLLAAGIAALAVTLFDDGREL